jgi:hypothetical protein
MKSIVSGLVGLSLIIGSAMAQAPAASPKTTDDSTKSTTATKAKKHKKHAAAKAAAAPASTAAPATTAPAK